MKQLAKQKILSFLRRCGYVVMREDDWGDLYRESERWRDRRRHIVQHPPIHGQPDIQIFRTQAGPGVRHIEIAERLICAFTAASRDEADRRIPGAGDDLWTAIQKGELASFWNVMERKDPHALSEYLLRFGDNGTGFGGLTFHPDGYNQIRDESHIALSYFDKVVSLAEAMGCLPYENPEQGLWGENLYKSVDEILDAIEEEFGAPITPPQNAIGVFGIQTSRGVFHYRHLNALYAAWRIKTLLSSGPDAVCEYGGGLGAVPYFLRSLGFLDYTIYDLPIANVFAGHFLMNSLSPEDVALYGEKGDTDTIKVLPYWECRNAPDKRFALTINQDSFPEIDEAMVRSYLSEILRTTRSFFISINQEGQAPIPGGGCNLNISRMMKSLPSFSLLHRSRYWIREGYVEEIYKIGDDRSGQFFERKKQSPLQAAAETREQNMPLTENHMMVAKHPIIFNTPKRLIEVSSWITHTPFAFFLISILKPKAVVELGVFSGQSYGAFCQAVKTLRLDTRCYGIDTWKGDTQLGAYGEDVYEDLYSYNQREYGDFSRLLRMTFDDALSRFEDGSIDLLHIDGFHTYEGVKNDFESWLPKMSPRGVMVFHDTFIKDLDFGVWKLWEEISQKYPGFEFVHGYGLGVAAVGTEVDKDFSEFLHEANGGRFVGKLFNALGQLALSEARINRLSIDSHKQEQTEIIIPDFNREDYMDTVRSVDAMPLPPEADGKKKCAIFVMVKDEDVFLPIWLKYYSRYMDGSDIYVFDHRSIDGSVQKCMKDYQFNVIRLNYPLSFDHLWFKFVADTVQKKLLQHYEYVIFTDIDEIILPDVNKYKGLDDYIQKLDKDHVRCIGYDLIHLPHRDESPYDASRSVLSQRRFWYHTHWYNKTLISRQPLNWEIGFHVVRNLDSTMDEDLMLIHLHKLDFDLCWRKSFERARLKWPYEDIINNRGWQNRITDIDKFRDYYEGWPDNFKIEEIPEDLRKSNIF